MEKSQLLINLGLKIKELRAKKNISQQELSDLIGVKRQYISQIETGDYNVTIDTLNKIANAFEINISDLLEGVEGEHTNSI